MKKMLIVYYSYSNGNTERIAKMLQENTNADIVKIDTLLPYPDDYNETVNQGQREVKQHYQPAIKLLDKNVLDYDVIALGTPTWWYTMAPAVLTFLKSNDFTNKVIIPFMTNAGWPGHVIKDMVKNSNCLKSMFPMEIKFDSNGGNKLETNEKEILDWTNQINDYLNS